MRALNNLQWHRGTGAPTWAGSMQSLSGFGPDINQPRDPRNGRAGELPTEDPTLAAEYAVEYVRGCQEIAGSPGRVQFLAGLKHFAVYSLETGRMGSKAAVSLFDLWDTYLPPFQAGFVRGGASGAMCAYVALAIGSNATGNLTFIPACANKYLLDTVVREYWGRADATHTSDCGAVANMFNAKGNHFEENGVNATAAFINGGGDVNTEYTVPEYLPLALEAGLVSEAALDASISRTLGQRLRAGMLDPLEAQPARLFELGQETLGSGRALALDSAAQGTVLLRNSAGALPLRRGARVALIGMYPRQNPATAPNPPANSP
jgi:beta-D-xylosidase 4